MKLRSHVPQTFHKKEFWALLMFWTLRTWWFLFQSCGSFPRKSPLECVLRQTTIWSYPNVPEPWWSHLGSGALLMIFSLWDLSITAWWSQLFISTDLRIPKIEGTKHQNHDLSALRLQHATTTLMLCSTFTSNKDEVIAGSSKRMPHRGRTGTAIHHQVFNLRRSFGFKVTPVRCGPGKNGSISGSIWGCLKIIGTQHGFRMTSWQSPSEWIHSIGPVRSHLHIFCFQCPVCVVTSVLFWADNRYLSGMQKSVEEPRIPGRFGVSSLHVSLHVNLLIIKIKSKQNDQNETLLFKITSFTILAARNPIVHSFAGYIPKLRHQANKTNLSCLN